MAPSKSEQDQAASEAVSNGHKSSDVAGKENEWKFREPYKIHSNDGFKALYEGGCHCGKVRYQLSREQPLSAKFCHCTTCQVLHGAPFQQAAIFHKSDINFTSGHHNLTWYDSGDKTDIHKLPCKVSCEYCHSPIMDEGRTMILLFPTLLKFKNQEEKDRFKPTMHMFYKDRVVDITDGMEKWEGMNGKSRRLTETGAVVDDGSMEDEMEVEGGSSDRGEEREQKGSVGTDKNSGEGEESGEGTGTEEDGPAAGVKKRKRTEDKDMAGTN